MEIISDKTFIIVTGRSLYHANSKKNALELPELLQFRLMRNSEKSLISKKKINKRIGSRFFRLYFSVQENGQRLVLSAS